MSQCQQPNSLRACDMLKAICSAGERCSCADKNYQWYSTSCQIAIEHVNAISLRLFGTMGLQDRVQDIEGELLRANWYASRKKTKPR